jgi:hypothetical protein
MESTKEYFASEDFIKGVTSGYREGQRLANILYLATFIMALFVIYGGLPNNTTIELFGVKLPTTIASQQTITTLMAGAFSYYTLVLFNVLVAGGMIRKILEKHNKPHWQYFAAKYATGFLWSGLVAPGHVGYKAKIMDAVSALSVLLASISAVFIHFATLLYACNISIKAAYNSKQTMGILFSTLSSGVVAICMLSIIFLCFVPIRHKFYPIKTGTIQ